MNLGMTWYLKLTLGDYELGDDMISKICSWYNWIFAKLLKPDSLIFIIFLSQTLHILCFLADKIYLYGSRQSENVRFAQNNFLE